MSASQINKSFANRCVSVFGYCVNKLWLLFAGVIIFLALLHISLGLFLPEINRYKTEMVEWVEEKYDVNISVKHVSAEWSSQGPVLKLRGFNLISKNETSLKNKNSSDILKVGEVSLYFDLLTSLWNWRFSTQEIVVHQADIRFYINQKLGVTLNNGISTSEPIDIDGSSNQIFDLLFGQRKISVTDSHLTLYSLSGSEFHYNINQLDVKKFEEVHQLSGLLSHKNGGELTLVTEVFGDPSLDNSYTNIYIEARNIELADLPWVKNGFDSSIKSAGLSWELWGRWQDKQWKHANGKFQLKDASLKYTNSQSKTMLKNNVDLNNNVNLKNNHMSAMFSWEHNNQTDGYASIHHIKTFIDNEHLKDSSDFFIKFEQNDSSDISWKIIFNKFQLSSLSEYIGNVIDDSLEWSKLLKRNDFSLLLDDLRLEFTKNKGRWSEVKADFLFSDLHYTNGYSFPKLNGLSGKGKTNNFNGFVNIKADNINLDFGDLFRNTIEASHFDSLVSWQYDISNKLNINSLNIINDDLTINAKGSLFKQDNKPILSLYAELTDVNAANKSLYLPTGIMTEGLTQYLDESIKKGSFPLVKTVLRGSMKEFPFASSNGLFVVLGDLKGAEYQYLSDWPILKELDAMLLFEGNSMDIKASHATTLNNKVPYASAVVKDFSLKKPKLELSFEVLSENNAGRDFIEKTPINFIANSISTLDFQGELKTKIDMKVGLSSTDNTPPVLKGHILFSPLNAKLKTPYISVDSLSGKLNFNEKGVIESHLKTRYEGRELLVKLKGKENLNDPFLSLELKGVISPQGVADLSTEQWSQYVSGETAFTSLIQFSPFDNKDITRIHFQSDLLGMKVKLPGALAKSEESISELFLTLNISNQSNASTGNIKWNGLTGKWFWNGLNSIDYGGDFSFNKELLVQDAIKPAIRIQGNLQKESLGEWLNFIEMLGRENSESEVTNEPLVFEKINLELNKLQTKLFDLDKVHLELNKNSDKPWNVNLLSAQGQLNLTLYKEKPWLAKLKNVNLKFNKNIFDKIHDKNEPSNNVEKNDNKISKAQQALQPSDFFDVDINCENCFFQEKNYGDFIVELRKNEKAVDFYGTLSRKKSHNISLLGRWHIVDDTKLSKLMETNIQFDLKSGNVGKMFKHWGYDAGVKDSSGRLTANATWEGAPWDFDYKRIESKLQLSLGKGYLTEISDGEGRILSLFNLKSLVRKLTFDFKDVYKKGFFFDSIKGSFNLVNGVISTENVKVKGNVADVKLYGSTDFKNETVEQLAVVSPHITSSFPVLAAWALEPTTGLIVFLVNKIMEPAIEVATRIDYRVHGGFDDFVIDKLKVSKKKVKVEYESIPGFDSFLESKNEAEINNKLDPDIISKSKSKLDQKTGLKPSLKPEHVHEPELIRGLEPTPDSEPILDLEPIPEIAL